MSLSTIFGLILLVLPLPGFNTSRITDSWFQTFVSRSLHIEAQTSDEFNNITARLPARNVCALPFATPLCQVMRFPNRLVANKNKLIGPLTGHLAINVALAMSIGFEGAPVSRDSAIAVIVLNSPKTFHVIAWTVRLGSRLDIDGFRAIPLPCQGLYAIDITYSGRDPLLGRVRHREVISVINGRPKTLFTTGGFVPGPMGSFSVGPGYAWAGGFSTKLLLTHWHFDGCKLISAAWTALPGAPIKVTVTTANLETGKKQKHDMVVSTPMGFQDRNSMIRLASSVLLLRWIRPFLPPINWELLRVGLTVVVYVQAEISFDLQILISIWEILG